MKLFHSYLTEIFDTHYPWRLVSSGSCSSGECWDYQFDCLKLQGTNKWIPEIELDIPKGRPVSVAQVDAALQKRRQQYAGERQRIIVTLTRKMGSAAFREWSTIAKQQSKNFRLEDWEQVWELGFGTFIDTDGSGYDEGTDEDIGGKDPAHATRIFGTIIRIVQAFVIQKKPKGIMWGTKPGANPARKIIYSGIAKRLAMGMGGKIIDIPTPRRGEITNCQVAWFGKTSLFTSRTDSKKAKPNLAKNL